MEADPNVIMQVFQNLIGQAWFNVVTAVIALGAAISALFPSKIKGEGWFGKALQLVLDLANAAGINFGKAKNSDADVS